MKGETPNTATPVPLMRPMRSATAMAPRQPAAMMSPTESGTIVMAESMIIAEMTEVRAIVVPTARSNPPVSNTIIWPSETSTR